MTRPESDVRQCLFLFQTERTFVHRGVFIQHCVCVCSISRLTIGDRGKVELCFQPY